MHIRMQNSERLSPQQISEFLKGSEEISFIAQSKVEVYGWVQRVLGSPGVLGAGQEATRSDPSLCREGDGTERAASNAADPEIPADRDSGAGAVPAATISGKVRGPGQHPVGGGGPGARMAKRAGHTTHSQAGGRTGLEGG